MSQYTYIIVRPKERNAQDLIELRRQYNFVIIMPEDIPQDVSFIKNLKFGIIYVKDRKTCHCYNEFSVLNLPDEIRHPDDDACCVLL